MVRRARKTSASIHAYLRVSTDDQSLGLDAQRDTVQAWATRQGVSVTAWHADEGVSGGNDLADRPALLEAISALARGDILVVSKRDRLARDAFVAASVARQVEKIGARIVSADGVANGDGPAEALMRHMLDGMAEFERRLIAQRTAAALAVKASRGERIGGIPYGMRLASDGLHLEADEREAQVLARIRELEPGRSCQGIADALADEGLHNREGKPFARQAIYQLIRRNAE